MNSTKQFTLAHVLCISTGVLVTDNPDKGNGIGQVYDILNYMTGDNLYTHALPRAIKECAPYLLEAFPELQDISTEGVNRDTWQSWYEGLKARLPATYDVRPIHKEDHEVIDPIEELRRMRPDVEIIQIEVSNDEDDINPIGNI